MNKNKTKQYKIDFFDSHGYLRCENCGKSNSFSFDVHHIVYRSELGKSQDINNKKNLILLCRECHNLFHSDKSVRNPLIKKRGLNKLYNRNFLINKKKVV